MPFSYLSSVWVLVLLPLTSAEKPCLTGSMVSSKFYTSVEALCMENVLDDELVAGIV